MRLLCLTMKSSWVNGKPKEKCNNNGRITQPIMEVKKPQLTFI